MQSSRDQDREPERRPSEIAATLDRGPESELDPNSMLVGKGSKRKGLLIAGGAVVLFGGLAAAFGFFQHRDAMEKTESAFSDLSQCLVGEPIASPEEAIVKFHRHQVALITRGPEARADGAGEAWPERCALYALKVQDAAENAGLGGDGATLQTAAVALAKALKEKRCLDSDVSTLLDNTFQTAAAGKVRAKASTIAGPPAHKTPLTLDELPESAFVTPEFVALKSLSLPVHPSGGLQFLFDQKDGPGPFSCRAESEKLVCAKLPPELAKMAHPFSMLGSATPGGPFLLFAGNRGDVGIYRSDSGKLVDKLSSYGGDITAEGAATVVGYIGDRVILSHQADASKPAVHLDFEDELKAAFDGHPPAWGNGFYNIQVFHGRAYVRGRMDDGPITLWTFPLRKDGGLGKAAVVGEIPSPGRSDAPHLLGCKSADGRLSIRVKGYDRDYFSSFADGAFSKPVEGPDMDEAPIECFGSQTGFITPFVAGLCTSAGCSQSRKTIQQSGPFEPRPGTYSRAFVGQEVVTVWAAGARGGLRGFKSNLESLDKTPDDVIFDDRLLGGKVIDIPTVSEARVLGAGSFAVLLLQTKKGLAAVRVGADGALSPMAVEWK